MLSRRNSSFDKITDWPFSSLRTISGVPQKEGGVFISQKKDSWTNVETEAPRIREVTPSSSTTMHEKASRPSSDNITPDRSQRISAYLLLSTECEATISTHLQMSLGWTGRPRIAMAIHSDRINQVGEI
jgi:hypothetical protein